MRVIQPTHVVTLSSNHFKTNLFIAFLQSFDPGDAGESDDSDDDGKILSSSFLYKLYIAWKTVDILQYSVVLVST